VDVKDAPRIPAEQHRADQAHVAGQTDQINALPVQQSTDLVFVSGLVGEELGIHMISGDAETGRLLQAPGVLAVADDQAHAEIGALGPGGADDGREVAPSSREKYGNFPAFHSAYRGCWIFIGGSAKFRSDGIG
jgi:hypothetical protein